MTFESLSKERVILFDGAMGTRIQSLNLPAVECNELLCLTEPEAITSIHRKYYESGADIAVTNTFGANRIVLAEYGLEDRVAEINIAAIKCAKDAQKGFENKFIALSVGPGSKLPTLGQIDYDDLYNAYLEQITAGSSAGADIIIIETCQDLLQMKTAVIAAMKAAPHLPIMVSFTVEESDNLLVGTDIQCVAAILSSYPIFSLGINCGFGPDRMAKPLEELAKHWNGRLYLSSNAGMPALVNGKLAYHLSAEDFANLSFNLAKKHNLFAVGGCCGTGYEHISAVSKLIKTLPASNKVHSNCNIGLGASAYSVSALKQLPSPTWVGERANATGSKAFRDLLKADNYAEMANIARKQESSHIIDLSVAYSGRNEIADMVQMAKLLNADLTAPIMIDSTSTEVIRVALERITGKPVINSINFEDGGGKLHEILKLLKYHPAAVVGLTIDESGMAQSKEDKLAVAERIYNVWTNEYGYSPKDLLIDFLTFSVASGDVDSRYAAVNTLGAITEFKRKHPDVNTVLGVSNVSFGLSPAARTILNSVFLNKAVQAGLDAAIVHTEKIIPIANLNPKDIELSEALLDGKDGALDAFIAHFADIKEVVEVERDDLAPADRLFRKVLKGDSSELEKTIDELLQDNSAMEILNDILMPAMQKVGEEFGSGRLLLPFVLKSAEVMKRSSDKLMPHLQGGDGAKRGKIVLATVRGDVHDIGKNLVDIILSGNGYEVINMGTKVSGADIVKKAQECGADAIAMSGLLVKSVEIMKENIELIREAGLDVKVLLGGAALSAEYVQTECSPILPGKVYYCKDAFAGIDAMRASSPTEKEISAKPAMRRILNTSTTLDTVTAEFIGRSEVKQANLDDVLPLIGKISLFEGRWGHREGQTSLSDMETKFNNIVADIKSGKIPVTLSYIYGFYHAQVRGEELWLNNTLFATFPRMESGDCIADLYKTTSGESILPLQLVTLGGKVTEYLAEVHKADRYAEYYELHGFFAELTDALADYANEEVASKLSPKDWHRFSFGYPLCPDLQGNKITCDLLNAADIGVSVNETCQMEPIYSTCAMLA
ncbi:MAG: homocysteine S-methyltransferase family protein [Deferribacteraceae bacterium]|jgi:5-methyltetrahydrofolate--homocysteine methyltransferase|nr:homocysteine S-methyltransferase family protein [Deferribacteraceae bacterium]